jgi:hypothetical protein
MEGNLYQRIKIRHAYDFSLCFPHELLMSFWMCNNNNNNNNNDLLSVFPYNGSSPDKTTTTISKEIVRKL